MAAIAFSVALLEREVSIQRPTHMASLTGRRPPVDFHDGGTGVAGHPLKDSDELSESKVGGLSSPQALHPIEIEVLDTDDGVFSNKLVRKFEEPIASAVADALADALQVTNRTPVVPASFLTAGYRTMSCSQLFERSPIPLGRIYYGAVIQIEKVLQTEIHPDSFTCSRIDVVTFLFGDDDEIDVSQRIALHGERFDGSLDRAGFTIFVLSSHDGDLVISMESIPRLFEREAGIPTPLFERGR